MTQTANRRRKDSRLPAQGLRPLHQPAAGLCLGLLHLLRLDDVWPSSRCWPGISFGHHAVNYADSYRYVGFPAGVLVLVVALPIFAVLWVRGKMSKVAFRLPAGLGFARSNFAT